LKTEILSLKATVNNNSAVDKDCRLTSDSEYHIVRMFASTTEKFTHLYTYPLTLKIRGTGSTGGTSQLWQV